METRRRDPWSCFIAMLAVIVAITAASRPAAAQDESATPEPDPWGSLKLLAGSWEGAIEGKLGTGRGIRRYELMGDAFLVCRHASVRLPQEKSPRGDQHEELGVFSYDSERRTIVYREFFPMEGVVVRSPCAIDGMRVVCTAEAVESGSGIRARLTLEIVDRYRFKEVYELAFPGQDLSVYFTNEWTRIPQIEVLN